MKKYFLYALLGSTFGTLFVFAVTYFTGGTYKWQGGLLGWALSFATLMLFYSALEWRRRGGMDALRVTMRDRVGLKLIIKSLIFSAFIFALTYVLIELHAFDWLGVSHPPNVPNILAASMAIFAIRLFVTAVFEWRRKSIVAPAGER